jgi:hypothetical protein
MTTFKRPLAKTIWKAEQVTSGEAAASSKSFYIYSGGSKEDFQFVAQVRRSNVPIGGFSFAYASGTGIITVGNSGAGTLTENDLVTVIGCFGNLS